MKISLKRTDTWVRVCHILDFGSIHDANGCNISRCKIEVVNDANRVRHAGNCVLILRVFGSLPIMEISMKLSL